MAQGEVRKAFFGPQNKHQDFDASPDQQAGALSLALYMAARSRLLVRGPNLQLGTPAAAAAR